MFQLLNRLVGGLIGSVLYPIKSLIINVVLISLAALVAPLICLIVPYVSFSGKEENFVELLVNMFIVMPLLLVVCPFIAVGVLIGACVTTVYDVFDTAVQGFVDGVEKGFSMSMLDQLWSDHTLSSTFLLILNEFFKNSSENNSEPQSLNQRIESYVSSCPFSELIQEEKLVAKTIAELKDDFKRYNDLISRLQSLDVSLNLKGSEPILPDIDDEVMAAFDIRQPSLLVKQYYDAASHSWRAVPASTRIIDQANLSEWWKQCDKQKTPFTHPLNRDNINAPEKYNGHETRYRIHPYQSMVNAQELVELTSSIREHLAKAQAQFSLTNPLAPIVFDSPLNRGAPGVGIKPNADSVLTSGLH